MPAWGMMTELTGGLITWAVLNVLFVSFFLFGGWRRERFVRVPQPPNPSVVARPAGSKAFGVAIPHDKTR
jgi:hypothetical protein